MRRYLPTALLILGADFTAAGFSNDGFWSWLAAMAGGACLAVFVDLIR